MISLPCPICNSPCSIADTSCPSCGYTFKTEAHSSNLKTATDTSQNKLTPCPDCGHPCSTAALSCPNCGRPFQKKSTHSASTTDFSALESAASKSTSIGTVAVITFLFLLAGGGVLFFFYGYEGSESQSSKSTSSGASANALSEQAVNATNDALKALRKLGAATQVGVSYIQYGSLLIDAQAQVNEALPLLPNGVLKNEISLAMEAYSDATLAWPLSNNEFRILFSFDDSLDKLRRKYSIPAEPFGSSDPVSRRLAYVNRKDLFNAIWGKARTHTDRASSMLNNQK